MTSIKKLLADDSSCSYVEIHIIIREIFAQGKYGPVVEWCCSMRYDRVPDNTAVSHSVVGGNCDVYRHSPIKALICSDSAVRHTSASRFHFVHVWPHKI